MKNNDIVRLFILDIERLGLIICALSGIHRVDTVVFDLFQLFRADLSLYDVGRCCAYDGLFILI